jgi:hypothetical protein
MDRILPILTGDKLLKKGKKRGVKKRIEKRASEPWFMVSLFV